MRASFNRAGQFVVDDPKADFDALRLIIGRGIIREFPVNKKVVQRTVESTIYPNISAEVGEYESTEIDGKIYFRLMAS